MCFLKKKKKSDSSGGPGAKMPCFQCRGPGSIPGQGIRIPHAMGHGQKEEKEKITLSERSQTQKDKNWMISLIRGPYYHLSHLGLPRWLRW